MRGGARAGCGRLNRQPGPGPGLGGGGADRTTAGPARPPKCWGSGKVGIAGAKRSDMALVMASSAKSDFRNLKPESLRKERGV